jgi:prefoldin subunit 5
MMAKMNLMKTNLLKIQDDVALLRKSFADVQQTLERLRDLVPKEPVPSSDTST